MSITIYINPSQEDSYDLMDFLQRETWDGAYDRMRSATEGQREKVVDTLQDIFSEPTDMTAINDFLWFECDYIFDGYEYEDEDEDEDEDEE